MDKLLGRLVKYQCCFCGDTVAHQDGDPLMFSLALDDEGAVQDFFCHTECLRTRLHPSVPFGFGD